MELVIDNSQIDSRGYVGKIFMLTSGKVEIEPLYHPDYEIKIFSFTNCYHAIVNVVQHQECILDTMVVNTAKSFICDQIMDALKHLYLKKNPYEIEVFSPIGTHNPNFKRNGESDKIFQYYIPLRHGLYDELVHRSKPKKELVLY
jgi:hypothetical protein